MATALSAWEVEILPDIPNLPRPALENAVRNACIEFCERTLLWTEDLTRITVAADTREYDLTEPSGATIICIDDVKYKQNGQDDSQFVTLDPVSENQRNLQDSGSWKYRESTNPSGYYALPDNPTEILLYNIPTVASTSGLLVKVCLRPARDCTTVQDFIYKSHFKTIGLGTKADLFARKGQKWFDAKTALGFEARFNNACDNAMLLKVTGGTKRETRVQMREFI